MKESAYISPTDRLTALFWHESVQMVHGHWGIAIHVQAITQCMQVLLVLALCYWFVTGCVITTDKHHIINYL